MYIHIYTITKLTRHSHSILYHSISYYAILFYRLLQDCSHDIVCWIMLYYSIGRQTSRRRRIDDAQPPPLSARGGVRLPARSKVLAASRATEFARSRLPIASIATDRAPPKPYATRARCRTCWLRRTPDSTAEPHAAHRGRVRGWRNTVEIVLFEISNSMKPYPFVAHTYTSELRSVIGLFEPHKSR